MSSQPDPPVEREVKIRLDDLEAARRRLEEAGARAVSPLVFEDDCLFDDVRGSLSGRGLALRLRSQCPVEGGGPGRASLTWKGPVTIDGGHRVREEVETTVGDPAALRHVLQRLGYLPSFRYQKVRQLFDLGGALVALDRTPLGSFLEIEGEAHAVDAAATRLGHSPAEYVTGSYPALWRELHPTGDMLLSPETAP